MNINRGLSTPEIADAILRTYQRRKKSIRKKVFGTHDDKTLAQLEDVASRAERAALMADGHLGYIMPIGGVAAYDEKVSVSGNGFDIACGNAAFGEDVVLVSDGCGSDSYHERGDEARKPTISKHQKLLPG